jgi:uncharacterized delta-60 repeat protein
MSLTRAFKVLFSLFLATILHKQLRSQDLSPGGLDPSFVSGAPFLNKSVPIFISTFKDGSILTLENYRVIKFTADGNADYLFRTLEGDFIGGSTDTLGNPVLIRSLPTWSPADSTDLLWIEPNGNLVKSWRLPYVNPTCFALQRNGQVLLEHYGPIHRVYRLNVDRSMDTNFVCTSAPEGVVSVSAFTRSKMFVQNDGKIIITGNFLNWGGLPRRGIVRLNENGVLDGNYAPGVYLAGPNYGILNEAALQSDDKLVVAGSFGTAHGKVRKCIARFNQDGTLDESLNFEPPAGLLLDSYFKSIDIAPDGKLAFGTSSGHGSEFLFRLFPNGGIEFSYPISAPLVLMRDDGRIIASDENRSLKQIKQDGTIDPVFRRVAPVVNQIGMDSDGDVWIAGTIPDYVRSERSWSGLGLINEDGSLTPKFSGAGLKFSMEGDYIYTLNGRQQISRMRQDGQIDSMFNPGLPANAQVNAISATSDGKLVVGGYLSTFAPGITRLLPDGTKDPDFSASIDGTTIGVTFIEEIDNGRLLVGGDFYSVNGQPRVSLAILNRDGSLDTTFNAGSMTTIGGFWPPRSVPAVVYSAKRHFSGEILAVGAITSVQGQVRLSGARFDSSGKLLTGLELPNYGKAIAIQEDGKIVIATKSDVVRFLPDGNRDVWFTPAKLVDESPYPNVDANSMVIDRRGRLVVAGRFNFVNGYEAPYMFRLLTNFSPPRLNAGKNGSGTVGYVIEGPAAPQCLIEFSSDLLHWNSVMTEAPFHGKVELSFNPTAKTHFVRASFPP